MKPFALTTVLALIVGGSFMSSAGADTVEARFKSVDPNEQIRFTGNGGQNWQQTRAGFFNWDRTGGTYTGDGADGMFFGFCIELNQGITTRSPILFDVIDPADAPRPGVGMGETKADQLSQLFAQVFDPNFGSSDAAAFQIAVWEISQDDGLDVRDGKFQVRGTDPWVAQAQDFLDRLDDRGSRASLIALSNLDNQDQIVLVPVPATMMMLLGGSVLGLASRRRRHA